ncbi:proline-rich protein 23A3-like [Microtus oregoni]|uniref:proline-rich protein 23A3-like n=1 Tax=Microtus oregoni TaxID=111838 RepID=UPI001BB1FAEC|nr:proline-rich protein 23A3-like [Microtus oregoni]
MASEKLKYKGGHQHAENASAKPRGLPGALLGPTARRSQPAKRRRLQEPACLGSLAQPDLEASARPASKELTSTVVIPTSCAMQLHLEGIDLLLEPEPTSVKRVLLPGHTIILVPEGLQASSQPGQAVLARWHAGTRCPGHAPGPPRLWPPPGIQCTCWPLPRSQLQPLPPSPPPSHQEQISESCQKPPRPLCRAKRHLS